MMQFLSSLHFYSDWGLLAMRLAICIIFLAHGPKKLSGAQGGFMLFIGICETLGALAMLLGFLTQLAAMGLGIIMLGAMYKKKFTWHVPFSTMSGIGWEFDLMILGACLALITLGAGAMSVDAVYMGL